VDTLGAIMVGMDTAVRFIGLWEDLEIQAWDTAGSEDSVMAVLGVLAAIDAAHAAATIRAAARVGGAIMITIGTIDRPPIGIVLRSGSTESLRVI
jgi:hypothetical protein